MTSDDQLLENYARRGDVRSLTELVDRHSRWMAAYLRGLTRSKADADDAFQDAWVRVMRSCRGFRGGSVRAYLLRTARSALIDRYRRAGRPWQTLDETDVSAEISDAALGPDETYDSKSTAEDVRLAIATLSPGLRDVLLMRIEGELTFQEIADQLRLPIGTVLSRMHAATLRLKKMLKGVK